MELIIAGAYGPYPKAGCGTSCYIVKSKNTAIALDFGSGALGGVGKYVPLDGLNAVVLSHLHYDHMSDILPYSYYAQFRGIRPKIIMPFGDCPQYRIISSIRHFDTARAAAGAVIGIGDFTLEFESMTHPAETYAVKVRDGVKTLVYSGDTSFNERIIPFCKGADLILLDCGNFADAPGVPHLSLREAELIADKSGAKAIAVHLNPEYDYMVNRKSVIIAEEGKNYKL
jgi:ribonuclease BN (tRNA processing enzyme)